VKVWSTAKLQPKERGPLSPRVDGVGIGTRGLGGLRSEIFAPGEDPHVQSRVHSDGDFLALRIKQKRHPSGCLFVFDEFV